MIKTTTGNKYIGMGLVFMTPGQAEIKAAKNLDEEAEQKIGLDAVVPMVQLQILDEKLNVTDGTLMTPDEANRLAVNIKAVVKAAPGSGDLVDRVFDAYREKVKKEEK